MADVSLNIKATDQGSQKIDNIGRKLEGLNPAGLRAALGIAALGTAAIAAGKAFEAVWGQIERGAQLERLETQFSNLAASIGTTAAALGGGLKEATKGLISDAELMATANQIISFGLADTTSEVERMVKVVSQLGLNMDVLNLTLANDSKMRLDALGLSVQDVTERMEKFKEAGIDASEAFDMAVLEALEDRLALLGDQSVDSAGKIQKLGAAFQNLKDNGAGIAAMLFDMAGGFEAVETGAINVNKLAVIVEMLGELRESGDIGALGLMGFINRIGRDGAEGFDDIIHDLEMMNLLAGNIDPTPIKQWWQYAQEGVKSYADRINELSTALERLGLEISATPFSEQIEAWYQMGELSAKYNRNIREAEINERKVASTAEAMAGLTELAAGNAEEFAAAMREAAEADVAGAFAARISGFQEMIAAFGDPKLEGLIEMIGGEAVPNIQAMNDALYEQAAAAGADVGILADLGVATGQFSEEQATAALKAAALEERIRMLGAEIASGNLSPEQAIARLKVFSDNLDNVIQNSPYVAEVQVDDSQARGALGGLLEQLGTYANSSWVASLQATSTGLGGLANAPSSPVGGGTPNAPLNGSLPYNPPAPQPAYTPYVPETNPQLIPRAMGGPVYRGLPYLVGERGPELFVPFTGGAIVPGIDAAGGRSMPSSMEVHQYFYAPTSADKVGQAVREAGDVFLSQFSRRGGVA